MMETNAGVSFPVVFFDGEREINIGDVVVYPSMEFKNFQSILSQKIGISPHQISIFLDCRKKSRMETRRRIPMTGKVSFSAILLEKDCFFVVVLKRSRRERRRKSRFLHEVEEEEENFTPQNTVAPPQKLHLLRRNQGTTDQTFSGFVSPYYDQFVPSDNLLLGSQFLNYNNRLQNLQIQREKYLRSTNLYSIPNENYEFPVTNNQIGRDVPVCEECVKAMKIGKPVPFHWCVYDAVTVGFRSPAGPIARPGKRSN